MKTINYVLLMIVVVPLCLYGQGITIAGGTTFSLGSATFTLPGNWNNSGTFSAGTGTVVLNGPSGSQTIANAGGTSYYNLTVNKAAGDIILGNSITINTLLTLTSGDINLNGDTIILGGSAMLVETAGNTVKGVSGVIMTSRTLGANPGNVAGLGVDISSSPALGSTIIERGHRPDTIGASNSIARHYRITPTNNSGLNATAAFYYDDSELNNLTEANLGLFRSTDTGLSWNSVSGVLNTTGNNITAASIASFSKWSLFSTTNPPVGIDENASGYFDMPEVYALFQNYPNPFNPSTIISFDLPAQSFVVLKIFDVLGREVATLAEGEMSAGSHTKTWDASTFAGGVYFYKLEAKSVTQIQRSFSSIKKLSFVK